MGHCSDFKIGFTGRLLTCGRDRRVRPGFYPVTECRVVLLTDLGKTGGKKTDSKFGRRGQKFPLDFRDV